MPRAVSRQLALFAITVTLALAATAPRAGRRGGAPAGAPGGGGGAGPDRAAA